MAPILYYRHSASLEHETGAHPEGPGRIPAIESELERRGWPGLERREAPEVDQAVLEAIHPHSHVDSVRAMSEAGGGAFDPDTVASAGSYVAALHAAGGACAMVEALLAGEATHAFAGLRPPGHHAEPEVAMGFCLFNNVAVAARHALDSCGVDRVLILDWDVHHGNGTNDIFHASPEVLFASIHQSPLYPGTGPLQDQGSAAGAGHTINLPVPPGSGGARWTSMVEHLVVPAGRTFGPGLILVSAGFDAHRDDPLGSCVLDASDFADMARHVRALGEELDAPVGLVLEGGYDLRGLATSVAAVLEALGDATAPRSVALDPLTARYAEAVGRHWPVAASAG